jgi:hypothetical protein
VNGSTHFLICLTVGGLVSCSSPPPPSSPVQVGQLIENIHAWNGKQITVEGWLGKCEGYECAIFPDPKHASGGTVEDWKTGLSIGSPLDFKEAPADFDERAAPLQFRHVLLKARVNDRCFPNGCTDRADILQPIDIQPWKPSPR